MKHIITQSALQHENHLQASEVSLQNNKLGIVKNGKKCEEKMKQSLHRSAPAVRTADYIDPSKLETVTLSGRAVKCKKKL